MKKKNLLLIAISFLALTSCGGGDDDNGGGGGVPPTPPTPPTETTGKYVGGDISLLSAYESANTKYMDANGNAISNVLDYMKGNDVGWNSMRVRLFVNPPAAEASDGVVQDLAYVTALGKRIKTAGLNFMLDFHYSDSWADPAKQTLPSQWASLSTADLTTKMYTYTKECLQQLVANGATPDFIQIGNEISFGMIWPSGKVDAYHDTNWTVFAGYLNNAAKACREICPKAKIIVHTEQAANATTTVNYYKKLAQYNVDYDIIGLSYYPFWHNNLATLGGTLNQLATNFADKKVQIVETAYYYQWQPTDGSITYDFSSTWAISPAGQEDFADDLIEELKKHSNVNGLYWWFPEENGNGKDHTVINAWINRGLWNDNNGRALPALYELKDFITE